MIEEVVGGEVVQPQPLYQFVIQVFAPGTAGEAPRVVINGPLDHPAECLFMLAEAVKGIGQQVRQRQQPAAARLGNGKLHLG